LPSGSWAFSKSDDAPASTTPEEGMHRIDEILDSPERYGLSNANSDLKFTVNRSGWLLRNQIELDVRLQSAEKEPKYWLGLLAGALFRALREESKKRRRLHA
jgi:hypothetical protein